MEPLVSFCVPTFNGIKYLPELVESLLPQLDSRAEIIFSDDHSTDGTYEYCCELAKSDSRIKAFQNSSNCGMDRNFHNSVKHASGRYVWFSGQDDLFGPNAYAKFLQILDNYSDIELIYFNYRQRFDTSPVSYGITYLPIKEDCYCATMQQFFNKFKLPPTFLPAIVMPRKYWDIDCVNLFYDTLYVQVGCWLLGCKNASVYVVADQDNVECRCPFDSWKAKFGKMSFQTRVGLSYVHYIAARMTGFMPIVNAWNELYSELSADFAFYVIFDKANGMTVTQPLRKQLYQMFGGGCMYYLYIVPLLYMPKWAAQMFAKLHSTPLLRPAIKFIRRLVLPGKGISGK